MDSLQINTKNGLPVLIGNFECVSLMAQPVFFDSKPNNLELGGVLTSSNKHWKLFKFFEEEVRLRFTTNNHCYQIWDVLNGNELMGILRQAVKKGPYLFWRFDQPLLMPTATQYSQTECGKVAFATLDIAQKTLKDMPNRKVRSKQPVRAYQCDRCGLYHLASSELFPDQRIRRA